MLDQRPRAPVVAIIGSGRYDAWIRVPIGFLGLALPLAACGGAQVEHRLRLQGLEGHRCGIDAPTAEVEFTSTRPTQPWSLSVLP